MLGKEETMASLIATTFEYWRNLFWYWRGKSFTSCPYLREDENRQARVQLCSLALNWFLWDKPHYRHPSFAHDLRANLRNVAVPGTGLPLSVFCLVKPLGYLMICIVNPILCFLGAVNVALKERSKGNSFVLSLKQAYRQHLLFPDDWFSYWRLNCALASWYWFETRESGYDLENKWIFLQKCMEKDVPCSPFLDMKGLCIKHKNEEGGLGIYFYDNAMHGGDWIIQKTMSNDATVQKFLPKNAPLSTFRVMTGSRLGMASTGRSTAQASVHTNGKKDYESNSKNDPVFAFSCVFRAGRSGGLTDHNSILFDVDVANKKMGIGKSNMHWYQRGLDKILTTPWLNHSCFTHHPDGHIPVTGVDIKEVDEMLQACTDAHKKLFPGVPIAGWDVCLVDGKPKICFLEVNLMCNFFKGSFDKDKYFRFMEDYFCFLDAHKQN